MLTFLKLDDSEPAASADSVTPSADTQQDPVREAVSYLLERSADQERQLAKLSTDWQYLLDRSKEERARLSSESTKVAEKLDQQIQDLYANSVRLAEAIHQQDEHIKCLESRLNRLAEALILVARRPQFTLPRWGDSLMAWSRRWREGTRPATCQ